MFFKKQNKTKTRVSKSSLEKQQKGRTQPNTQTASAAMLRPFPEGALSCLSLRLSSPVSDSENLISCDLLEI